MRSAVAVTTGVAVGAVYLATLASSVSGGDAGELITAAATTGIPHPSGYPLYVLLTQPFFWLPIATEAWRANLASAVMGAGAAACLAWAVTAMTGRRWAGFAAAAVFAFSPTVWRYAVGAEVFSLNNLFVAAGLALLIAVDRSAASAEGDARTRTRLVRVAACVVGLGAANHLTSVAFTGPFLIAMAWRTRSDATWRGGREWVVLTACVAAGLLPYLYLPLATVVHPMAAWGETDSVGGLVRHVLRSDYGTFQLNANLDAAPMSLLAQWAYFGRDLVEQISWLGIGVAVFGLGSSAANPRTRLLALTTLVTAVAYLAVFHALASFPLDQPLFHGIVARFWQAPLVLVCLWIGWGLAAVRLPAAPGAILAIALAGGQVVLHANAGNRRHDRIVRDYGAAMLESAPPHALILTRGDLIANTTRYLHVVEGLRPDVRLLDQEMLTYPWMIDRVRQLMPDVEMPGTHYDIAAVGTFSLRALLDANIATRPVIVCGGTKPGDVSAAGAYQLVTHGLCDQVLPVAPPVDPEQWWLAAEAARPVFSNDMRHVPDARSWEYVAWTDYWASFHRTGVTALTVALERGDDPVWLQRAVTVFERLIADAPEPPVYAYKNLGLAYSRLTARDGRAAARALDAWTIYLRLGPTDDPERPAIEAAVRQFKGH